MNEILPNGEVVHLRKVELPSGEDSGEKKGQIIQDDLVNEVQKENFRERSEGQVGVKAETQEEDQDATRTDGKEDGFELDSADSELLNSIFGQDTTNAVVALYQKALKHPNWKARDFASVTAPPISDRARRTQAHQSVRRVFDSRLDSTTDPSDGSIKISAASKPNPHNARHAPTQTADGKPFQARGRGKVMWEQLGGEHLHFTLAKENKDTMEIVGFLAFQLKLNAKHFQFAGTKDRRAVAVQRVSAFRVHRDALARLNKKLYSARVGDFEYKEDGLELGELGGNEFTITLRDCHTLSEEDSNLEKRREDLEKVLRQRVDEFGKKGWINYYGLQRFGSFTHGTETIGLKMLQENFEGAIDLLMSYDPENLSHNDSKTRGLTSSDDLKRTEALHIWATQRDSRRALEKLPRRFNAESAIIKHLGVRDKKTGQMNRIKDFQGALGQISRNLRLMYVHAYQSLVWNVVAGKRIEMFGTDVVAGDLVVIGEKERQQRKDETNGKAGEEMEVDDAGEVIIKPTAGDSAGDARDNFTRARPLSQQEVESRDYDIFDVVLPLPGFDVVYPANAVGAFYEGFMGSERGGGLDPHNMRRKWKEISLSGGYRKLMARPMADIEWEVRKYSGQNEQLVETELERSINNSEKAEKKADTDTEEAALETEEAKDLRDERAENERIAVILKLQLGSSQYATMALRELTKGGVKSFKPEYSTSR